MCGGRRTMWKMDTERIDFTDVAGSPTDLWTTAVCVSLQCDADTALAWFEFWSQWVKKGHVGIWTPFFFKKKKLNPGLVAREIPEVTRTWDLLDVFKTGAKHRPNPRHFWSLRTRKRTFDHLVNILKLLRQKEHRMWLCMFRDIKS